MTNLLFQTIKGKASTALISLRQIYEEMTEIKKENVRLLTEVFVLKKSNGELTQNNERLHDQINSILEEKLNHLNINVDYENLVADHKATLFSLNSLQASFQSEKVEQKRRVFILERENEELSLLNERHLQQINQMTVQIEEMFTKMAETGYGELVSYNQRLLERVAARELEISEVNAATEKAKALHSEELSRQMFNYEILVSQYQTLLRENSNLIKASQQQGSTVAISKQLATPPIQAQGTASKTALYPQAVFNRYQTSLSSCNDSANLLSNESSNTLKQSLTQNSTQQKRSKRY